MAARAPKDASDRVACAAGCGASFDPSAGGPSVYWSLYARMTLVISGGPQPGSLDSVEWVCSNTCMHVLRLRDAVAVPCGHLKIRCDETWQCALRHGHAGAHRYAPHDCPDCGSRHGVCRRCGTTNGDTHMGSCPWAQPGARAGHRQAILAACDEPCMLCGHEQHGHGWKVLCHDPPAYGDPDCEFCREGESPCGGRYVGMAEFLLGPVGR